jgi:DNA primase
MKKVCVLILLAAACKAPVDNRDLNYHHMISLAEYHQSVANTYAHDNRPASLKRFADAMDSVRLYMDSAVTFMPDAQRAQVRRIDSLAKQDVKADRRYNDSVYTSRKR